MLVKYARLFPIWEVRPQPPEDGVGGGRWLDGQRKNVIGRPSGISIADTVSYSPGQH